MASVGLFFFLEFHLWADSYKILNYGSPERVGYDQIDSCGFDAIMEPYYSHEDTTHNNNSSHLDLFVLLSGHVHRNWVAGASFYFEADHYDWRRPGQEMRGDTSFFDTDTLPGEDKDDADAHNGYARRAVEGQHSAGYILANLRRNDWSDPYDWWKYNKWFSLNRMWSPDTAGVDSMSYHPRFRIRTSSGADSIELVLEVHVLFDTRDGFTIQKDSLWAADTVDTSSFNTLGEYQYFDVPYRKTHSHAGPDTIKARTDFRVWWNGKDQVWIDRVDVYDKWAYNCLFTHAYDQPCEDFMDERDNRHLEGFYLPDEPRPWQMNVQKYWHNFVDSTRPDKHVFTSWAKVFNYWLDYFLTGNDAPWHLVNNYVLNGRLTDTLSDTCYYYPAPESCRTLQEAIDTLLNYLDKHREIAQDRGKKLGYNTPLGAWYNRQTGKMANRHPTAWEQEAWIWLPLTHGAEVTSYWDYPSWYCNCTREPDLSPDDTTTAPWFFRDDAGSLWVAYLRALVYRQPDTTGGLWGRRWKHYEPYWSVVRRVNKQLHAIGDIISDTTSWQAGFTCDEIPPESWIDSFKSGRYSAASAYVEIATFEHNNLDYFLLVNRRCLSTEGQNVTVELDLPGEQYYIIGLDSVGSGYDMHYDFTDFTHSGKLNGKIPFSTYLAPGQGKFLKITPARRKI